MAITIEQVVAAIRDAGLEPRSYSGRGMYGQQCLGVNVGRNMVGEAMEIAACLVADGGSPEDVRALHTTYDSMGLGMVLYWPSLKMSDDQRRELADEEEEEF